MNHQELSAIIKDYNCIGYIENGYLFIVSPKFRTIKLPKSLTEHWVRLQCQKIINSQFKNLACLFSNLKLDTGIYYTSFGLSLLNFSFSKIIDKQINEVRSILDSYNIKYRCEYSDKYWVYRFIISQEKSNLEIIKRLA